MSVGVSIKRIGPGAAEYQALREQREARERKIDHAVRYFLLEIAACVVLVLLLR